MFKNTTMQTRQQRVFAPRHSVHAHVVISCTCGTLLTSISLTSNVHVSSSDEKSMLLQQQGLENIIEIWKL